MQEQRQISKAKSKAKAADRSVRDHTGKSRTKVKSKANGKEKACQEGDFGFFGGSDSKEGRNRVGKFGGGPGGDLISFKDRVNKSKFGGT